MITTKTNSNRMIDVGRNESEKRTSKQATIDAGQEEEEESVQMARRINHWSAEPMALSTLEKKRKRVRMQCAFHTHTKTYMRLRYERGCCVCVSTPRFPSFSHHVCHHPLLSLLFYSPPHLPLLWLVRSFFFSFLFSSYFALSTSSLLLSHLLFNLFVVNSSPSTSHSSLFYSHSFPSQFYAATTLIHSLTLLTFPPSPPNSLLLQPPDSFPSHIFPLSLSTTLLLPRQLLPQQLRATSNHA